MLYAVVLFFMLASVLGESFTPVTEDDPSIEVVRNVITRANYYLEDHLLTELRLPNIGGYLPTDVVTLTEGKVGQLNTLKLKGNPDIQKRTNSDSSTTYLFDVKLGLQQLVIQYQFNVKIIGFVLRQGLVNLTPEVNSIGATGIVVVKKDGQCDAGFYGFSVDKFDGIKLSIQPDDVPGLSTVSQAILNFVTPRVIPVTNFALNGIALNPTYQRSFSHFVCKEINRSRTEPTDSTTEPNDPKTEPNDPTEPNYSTTEQSDPTTEPNYPSTEPTVQTTEPIDQKTEQPEPITEMTSDISEESSNESKEQKTKNYSGEICDDNESFLPRSLI